MEEGLPEEDSELSREGVLLHDYAAHPEYDRRMLKPHQKDLVDLSDSLAAIVVDQAEREAGIYGSLDFKDFIEQTMLFRGEEFGTPDFTRYYFTEPTDHENVVKDCKAALVIDRKFGYNVVERADLNLQLRVYAVLAYDFGGFFPEKIFVGIVQPRAPFDERITMAQYTPDDIDDSTEQILHILKESSRDRARLIAGDEQCQYCKAKLTCPAFREAMMMPTVIVPRADLSKTAREAYLEQRVAELDDPGLEKVILACRLGAMVKDFAFDEARKRVANGKMTNFTVAKESEVREVVNVRKAMALLSLSGIDRAETYDCVTEFSLKTLAEKLRKKHPNWTWKQANDWINKKLQSVIEKSVRKGRLIHKS